MKHKVIGSNKKAFVTNQGIGYRKLDPKVFPENEHQQPVMVQCWGKDVIPRDHVKSRIHTFPIDLKFDKRLGNTAAEMPVKFLSDTIIITCNLAASGLHEIWQ